MSFLCTVEVRGYHDGKFSDDQASFLVELPFVPAQGDELRLEPGASWGLIRCMVVKRIISTDGVRVVARYLPNALEAQSTSST